MRVLVANRQRAVPVDAASLRRAALWAMRHEGSPPGSEVSIAVVDDAAMAELNRRYRRRAGPTDVLAFPQEGGGLLGDVVVSAERAAAQARRYRHTLERELRLLVIHGVLHLLGHEDTSPQGARRMRRRQQALLRSLEAAEGRRG